MRLSNTFLPKHTIHFFYHIGNFAELIELCYKAHCFIMEKVSSLLLPPATKLGQGYVFTGVCDSDSVHGGVSASVHAGIPHPPEQTHPPKQTPPQRRACWEIRSTRGRYASYWNAILFIILCSDWSKLEKNEKN